MNKSFAVGQWLRHGQFGPGVTVRGDAQRTTSTSTRRAQGVRHRHARGRAARAPEAPVRRRRGRAATS